MVPLETVPKQLLKLSYNGKSCDVDFYVDKTLKHARIIGTDLGKTIKRK